MVVTPSLSTVRQVKICATTGARGRVQDQAGLGAALGGLGRVGVRDPLGVVAVGGAADVVPVNGVLLEPAPGFLLQLEPVPLRDALLHPADQDRGGVHPFHVDRLVRGEQRDPGVAKLPFQLERVERVPAGALDVLAHHGGEPGRRAGGFGQQRGQAAVTGQADVNGLVGGAVAALLQVQAAGLDVPEPGGDEPAGRQLGLDFAGLPAQRGGRVL